MQLEKKKKLDRHSNARHARSSDEECLALGKILDTLSNARYSSDNLVCLASESLFNFFPAMQLV